MDNLTTQSTEELLQLIKEGAGVHSEAVIVEVEIILQERDVQYRVTYKKSKKSSTSNSESSSRIEVDSVIFAPFLVAVLLLVSPYILGLFIVTPESADPEHLFYLSIGAIVVKRIIVLALIDYYNKKLSISGSLWYILGLVFVAWSLLAYNIYLLANSERVRDDVIDHYLE